MNKLEYNYTGIDHPSRSYVVIDLEWNQPIPWIRTKVDPKELPGEIIEIGAVKLTLSPAGYILSEPFHMMVRPVCYKVMNKNVSRVTNKISEDLRFGVSFAAAYQAFLAWCGEDYIFCGWGNSDLSILKANLRFHGKSAVLDTLFLDAQPLFSRVAEGNFKQRSVEYAVDFLGIAKEEDFHKAHKDAEYTAKVLRRIFQILDDSQRPSESSTEGQREIALGGDLHRIQLTPYLQNPDLHGEHNFQTSLYTSWEKCFADFPKDTAICPACQKALVKQIPWFRLKKSAFSLWQCEDHYLIAGRIRMKKTPDGKFYGGVSYRLTNPAAARGIREKLEEYQIYGSKGKPYVPPLEAVSDIEMEAEA